MNKVMILFIFLASLAPTVLYSDDSANTQSKEGTTAYIVSPQDGETVESPFTVVFGLRGMGVAPAGVGREATGHHHLLIDLETLPDLDKPLPTTENIRHFGGGQTEVSLTLAPGRHTLQLLLANHLHIPHKPPVLSEPITVTVK